ncbi:MAG: hypothetical protein ABI175_26935 [Polyangiales bacterium]
MLTKSALPPRPSRLVATGICATAMLATAVIMKIALTSASPPPAPEPPKAAAPVVIPIAAPQLMVLQAPTPPPRPAPEIPAPPPPHATAPFIEIACVLTEGEGELPASCSWDHGFPAISADGTTIALQRYIDDGGRGNPGMQIELLDAATSRVKRVIKVLDPDEYVTSEDPKAPALRKTAEKRALVAQRLLDAGAYRSLTSVPLTEEGMEITAGLRVEVADELARVIDVATNAVVWQRRFSVAREFPNRKLDPEVDSCEPSTTGDITVGWDATTRTLLAEVSYEAGPCYCGSTTVDYVQHVR